MIKNSVKLVCLGVLLFTRVGYADPAGEIEVLKRMVALQEAELKKLKEDFNAVISGKKWIGDNSGLKGENGNDGKNGTNGVNGVNGIDGKNGLNGKDGKDGGNWQGEFCVISPKWSVCPVGFASRGNFYACTNNDIGIATSQPASDHICQGPYKARHITLCCK